MQYVLGAQDEGTILRSNLANNGALDEKYTFITNLYDNSKPLFLQSF